MGQLLEELGLEAFESEFCCRVGGDAVQRLASVRYEDLLEIGLSKVQCHLFLQKVSSLLAPAVDADRIIDVGSAASCELQRNNSEDSCSADWQLLRSRTPPLKEDRSEGPAVPPLSAAMLQRGGLQRRRLMPPPSTPGLDSAAQRCYARKRPRSSHLSTAGATVDPLASEQLSTAGSASGSSSSCLHQDVRVTKRRRLLTWSHSGRRRGSGPPSSRGHGMSSVGDPQALDGADFVRQEPGPWSVEPMDRERFQTLLQDLASQDAEGRT